jgi:predicted DNA binding CopG/RHH family protein
MSEKPIQLFTDEYLDRCRELSADEIVTFLDQFRLLAYAGRKTKSKLISIKVPEDLLAVFKIKAKLEGRPYQSIIKELMSNWVLQGSKQSDNPL